MAIRKGLPKTRDMLDKGENNLAGQTLAIQKGLPKTRDILAKDLQHTRHRILTQQIRLKSFKIRPHGDGFFLQMQ